MPHTAYDLERPPLSAFSSAAMNSQQPSFFASPAPEADPWCDYSHDPTWDGVDLSPCFRRKCVPFLFGEPKQARWRLVGRVRVAEGEGGDTGTDLHARGKQNES